MAHPLGTIEMYIDDTKVVRRDVRRAASISVRSLVAGLQDNREVEVRLATFSDGSQHIHVFVTTGRDENGHAIVETHTIDL